MRAKKNGLIALLMVCAIVLSACSSEPSRTPFKLDMMFLSKPKIVIAIPEALKQDTENGMKAFAKKVNDMSKGDMVVELLYCKDPMKELSERTADMVYASTEAFSTYTQLFEMLESPFYFRSYEHMTMTLNSKSFVDMVKSDITEKLGAQLLATVFSDASVILAADDYIESINSIKDLNITLRENESDSDIFTAMGAKVKLSNEDEMIAGFNSGDIKNIECRMSKFSSIQKPLEEDFYYITESWHDMKLDWFLVSKDYMDTQNSVQKAIIIDAAAVLVATIDKERIASYEQELDRLLVNGGEVSRYEPDAIRKKARETISISKNANKDNIWNMELYDNVQAIIR